MALHLRRREDRRRRFLFFGPERGLEDLQNPLEVLPREDVIQKYRLAPEKIIFVCDILIDNLERTSENGTPYPVLIEVLVTLRVLATGGFQILVGDALPQSISQPTVSRAVERVTGALVNHMATYIKMPQRDELQQVKREFENVSGFPGVLGCIDCTHIKIKAPAVNPQDFVDRKGQHSLNVQMVCDARRNIRNVVARWPGATHDSRIFRLSALCQHYLPEVQGEGYLLGDGGYPCRADLLTPYRNPADGPQERYNNALCTTRCLIERTFGILKRRFGCLGGCMQYSPGKVCRIVVCCAILHNLIGADDQDQELDEGPQPANGPQPVEAFDAGNELRRHITYTHFL